MPDLSGKSIATTYKRLLQSSTEISNTTLKNVFKETKYAVQDLPEININFFNL